MRGSEAGRTHQIDGTFNVRDVGGLRTNGGAKVRTGLLLRSASLDSVTPAGVEQLRALDLRTVIDLRSRDEVDRHGRFPTSAMPIRWEHVPSTVSPPSTDRPDQNDLLRNHPDPMAPMYREMLQGNGPGFARGFRILADPANLTTIVHCTSGKDRTGLFAVVLQLVLGVSLDDALASYVQDDATTKRALADMLDRYPEMGQVPPEKVERMAGTNVRWVTGALASIGGEHAVPEWLIAHGCDAHSQSRLRAIFLD